jgi:hypothetical protein
MEIARTHAVLGDKEQALRWLGKAQQARLYRILLVNCFPEFDNLHSDPRWKELLRRINFPEEQSGK